jgi:peptidoglycan/LPS O-acetylase OafA/YrhL
MKYRPDIDSLRAVSVLLVVANHAFGVYCPGGFVGVDIFFVISGYLITNLLLTEVLAGTFSLAGFYERRIRRIFPSLILVLATVFAVGWFRLLPSELLSLGKNTIASAFFSSNLLLLSEVDYFDVAARSKPLLHIWSLGVEEQFYIVWPLLLAGLTAWQVSLRSAIVVFIGASIGLSVYLTGTHPAAAYYLPFTRAWELGAGAAIVLFQGQIAKVFAYRFVDDLASLAGVALISYAAWSFSARTPFPGIAAAVPVLGASLIIAAKGAMLNTFMLGLRGPVFVGLISYPLYLWHWPILVYASFFKFKPLTDLERGLCVIAAIMLAWLTFRFVENPIRRREIPAAIPSLVGAMVCMAAVGIVAVSGAGFPERIPADIRQAANTTPGRFMVRYGECHVSPEDHAKLFQSCVENDRKPSVAIWGDSTAGALSAGFRQQDDATRPGITQFTLNWCEPLIVENPNYPPACLEANLDILQRIISSHPDVVLLHSHWAVGDEPSVGPTVKALRAAGLRVIIVGGVPIWTPPLPRLYADYYLVHGAVIPKRLKKFVQASDGEIKKTAQRLGVDFYSVNDSLCNAEGCPTRASDDAASIITADQVHLTPAGSKFVATMMIEALGLARGSHLSSAAEVGRH